MITLKKIYELGTAITMFRNYEMESWATREARELVRIWREMPVFFDGRLAPLEAIDAIERVIKREDASDTYKMALGRALDMLYHEMATEIVKQLEREEKPLIVRTYSPIGSDGESPTEVSDEDLLPVDPIADLPEADMPLHNEADREDVLDEPHHVAVDESIDLLEKAKRSGSYDPVGPPDYDCF